MTTKDKQRELTYASTLLSVAMNTIRKVAEDDPSEALWIENNLCGKLLDVQEQIDTELQWLEGVAIG